MAWYAVQARSNFEQLVANELRAKGFEEYCPVFKEVHQWADRKKVVELPVFPGYVFVRFAVSQAARLRILQTYGVVQILGVNGIPEAIPETELGPIRRMLDSDCAVGRHPFLQAGARVRVRRGALKDVEGVLVRVKNSARLVLSIAFLSQAVSTEVNIRDVEVLDKKRLRNNSTQAA
jgi:transcription antitermination factor NusG